MLAQQFALGQAGRFMTCSHVDPAESAPFFERAELRFECQRSGNCCKRPGYVFFTRTDIGRVAHHLGINRGDFVRDFLRVEASQWFLEVNPGPCRFYDGTGCTIQEVKPLQCRTWPFWPELVETEREWRGAGLSCPGIEQGPVQPRVEIRDTVERLRAARIPEPLSEELPSIDPQPAREIESLLPPPARRRP